MFVRMGPAVRRKSEKDMIRVFVVCICSNMGGLCKMNRCKHCHKPIIDGGCMVGCKGWYERLFGE